MCVCGIVTPHSLAVLGVVYGMFWPIFPSVLFMASIRFELKPISREFPRTLHNKQHIYVHSLPVATPSRNPESTVKKNYP
jgi:hypothetical protein